MTVRQRIYYLNHHNLYVIKDHQSWWKNTSFIWKEWIRDFKFSNSKNYDWIVVGQWDQRHLISLKRNTVIDKMSLLYSTTLHYNPPYNPPYNSPLTNWYIMTILSLLQSVSHNHLVSGVTMVIASLSLNISVFLGEHKSCSYPIYFQAN